MQNLVILKAVLDRVDGDSFETLEGRITFQKRVYLLQALGLDLGYTFSWNQYGPYSSELAQDGLLLETGVVDESGLKEPLRFTASAEKAFDAFEELTVAPSNITRAGWMELLSSLHYVATAVYGKTRIPNDDSERLALSSQVTAAKPYFANKAELLSEAWQRLDAAARGSLAAA